MKLSIHSKILAKRFTNVFSNLCKLTDTAVLHFGKDGLYAQGMDGSHVSLYEVKFDKSWFSTYSMTDEDAGQISVNLECFSRLLATRGDNQLIYMEYDGGSPSTLTIIFRSMIKESGDFPREYEMTLMDIDVETMEIPNDEQSVQFYIDSKMFASLIKQLAAIDETVSIVCNEEEILFRSKGIEGSMKVNLFDSNRDYVEEFMIDENYKLTISFALRYFHHFCAFEKVAPRVRLSFTNDFPVEVFYTLETPPKKEAGNKKPLKSSGSGSGSVEDDDGDDVEDEGGDDEQPKSYLRFFLAPKFEEKESGDEDEDEDEEDA